MQDVTLWHGDCLELMADIPDQSVDMILSDPPYATTACRWDVLIPFEPLWAHYKRVIKPRGAVVLTGSQPFTSMLVMSNPEWFRHEWIWDKVKPSGFQLAKVRPMATHESILVFSCKSPSYQPLMEPRAKQKRYKICGYSPSSPLSLNDGLERTRDSYYPKSILRITNADQTNRVHPTQKPVDLFAYLIRTYTNEGEVVLDNCLGSGTTAVAAIRTGRKCIGIEKEREYFEIAQKRVAEEYAKTALFAGVID